MSESDYIKISLNRELMEKIKQFIKDYPEHGYRTLGQFVEDAVRRRAEELRVFELTPRFEHFNLDEENGIVRIKDKKLGIIADIYLRMKNEHPIIWCEADRSTNCEHIKFALQLPKVKDRLEELGWILTEDGNLLKKLR